MIIETESGVQEHRKLNMVLSAKSCGLEEAFSEDLMNKHDYLFQKKPKLRVKDRDVDDIIKERLGTNKEEKEQDFEYRVKTGLKYKEVKEKVKGDISREQLLDMRVKKKTDKFCWI